MFGQANAAYERARPAYPEAVYDLLQACGALHARADVLEVGAGNGLATRQLLRRGCRSLLAVEPDVGFAPQLDGLAAACAGRFAWQREPFEALAFPAPAFDLAAAATCYHWLDAGTRVRRFADALQPGGALAVWWNVFGDPDRHDAFHEATQALMRPLASPSDAGDGVPFGLDVAARRAEFLEGALFDWVLYDCTRWTLVLDTQGVGDLYASFSVLLRLEDDARRRVRDALMEIATREFGGRVERNMCTPLYVLRRRA